MLAGAAGAGAVCSRGASNGPKKIRDRCRRIDERLGYAGEGAGRGGEEDTSTGWGWTPAQVRAPCLAPSFRARTLPMAVGRRRRASVGRGLARPRLPVPSQWPCPQWREGKAAKDLFFLSSKGGHVCAGEVGGELAGEGKGGAPLVNQQVQNLQEDPRARIRSAPANDGPGGGGSAHAKQSQ